MREGVVSENRLDYILSDAPFMEVEVLEKNSESDHLPIKAKLSVSLSFKKPEFR
jgi:endonuclease/exonuclease/phosphatase family metal-dependent hydrolase